MTELNWRTLTQQSLALPYGRARTTGLEKALDLAIRGGATEEDVFHLRMSLTEAYKYGGEPARAMTTFTRCLTAFDADPARYGPEAHHRLLWQFKWIIAALTDFPEIPLDRTYALLDDMERRYRESGYSLHPVHGLRCQVARHIGDVATADAEFERWRTAPQDESSDCAGCVPTAMAFHLAWRGAHAEAIAIAEPVLSGELTCVEQPQGILSALIEPYLRTGRYEAAVDAHRRTYRVHRRYETRYLFSLGTHLFFCAVTGNHARGLELLERHLGALDAPPARWTPWSSRPLPRYCWTGSPHAGTATSPCAVPRTRTAPPRSSASPNCATRCGTTPWRSPPGSTRATAPPRRARGSATALPPNRSWRNSR
ncbi:hypothetical protein TM51_09421 [Thermobifida fusca TM51]|uniref:Tetratricopeptide repeat protein n=1 Tax=Thermobifida fusca TM51 TaxID=1169414 RepID=A0A9P2TA12_THEFU|nr:MULTISPECIES: hypothetical protein [Thermobifida]EOR71083.1 hypothetical protein TM51_09421 [Thermobifida fusca TM51]MBO2530779.1 hypothetical protein [Thermobifida sp.]MDD6792096.1 hypothetical protein [Thermobifida fusca]PPS93541.1 hypothetical protein BH05_07660 [Thermobifida fusca]PZN62275.1 MAG: hypothetical protein DIU53_10965 [Thermobifida fusca]